jgi:hypothetical protein
VSAPNGRRAPPAYQEYAASRLADRIYKAMSAAERGVFYSMRLECWANRALPSIKRDLARVLGLDMSEVQQGLTKRVLAHFEERETEDDGRMLICPELEAYRQELERRHQKQSEGGKQTAATINKRRQAERQADGSPDGLADSSLDKTRTDQSRTDQSLESGDIPEEHKAWVQDFTSGEPDFAGGPAQRTKPGIRG